MNKNETEILRRVVAALLADPSLENVHYWDEDEDELVTLVIDNNTPFETIVDHAFSMDTCRIYARRRESRYLPLVYFIWGNGNDGWDAISDYSVSLEDTLKPVFDWIEDTGLTVVRKDQEQ